MDLILTGRIVAAEEALQIGLVNRLCKPGTGEQLSHYQIKFERVWRPIAVNAKRIQVVVFCLLAIKASVISTWNLDRV